MCWLLAQRGTLQAQHQLQQMLLLHQLTRLLLLLLVLLLVQPQRLLMHPVHLLLQLWLQGRWVSGTQSAVYQLSGTSCALCGQHRLTSHQGL